MPVGYQPMDISALFVDDEKCMRNTFPAFLKDHGVKVDVLETCAAGIEQVRKVLPSARPYDVVITDLNQHPSGIDLVREVRSYDETLSCYIITGGARLSLEDEAKALAEADPNTELLYKPIRKEQVLAIADAIRSKQIDGTSDISTNSIAMIDVAPGIGSTFTPADYRILVVDDAIPVKNVIVSQLSRCGYRVQGVCNGLEAVRLYEEGTHYDLLVLDIIMKPLYGPETYEQILAVRPKQKAIFITGGSPQPDRQKAIKLGAHVILEKPFDADELLKSVKEALAGNHS